MTANNSSATEILVHITAPSKASDDAIYRAFATAYRDFEPSRRINLPSPDPSPPAPSTGIASPQASFRSVWDNVRSPGLPGRMTPGAEPQQQPTHPVCQDEAHSFDSWIPPPSEVADSMPDNDISIAGFSTPTRVLQYFLQGTGTVSFLSQDTVRTDAPLEISQEAGGRHTPSATSQSGGHRNATTFYDGNEGFTSLLARGSAILGQESYHPPLTPTKDVRSEQPLSDASPIPDIQADDAQVAQTPSDKSRHGTTASSQSSSQSELEPSPVIIPSPQLPSRADSEPPPPKRFKSNQPEEKSQALRRSKSDLLPRGIQIPTAQHDVSIGDTTLSVYQSEAVPESVDWSLSTQIMSKEPCPGNGILGPGPPLELEHTAEVMAMKVRYKPKFQARELRPYERGYWLLSLDAWSHEAKIQAWAFLGRYIRTDSKAGWGTRACRDEQWGWIRLYGWEHIAGELYILLYLSSYRRLKYMEIIWYDGAGKELIIVPPRGKSKNLAA